MTSFFRKLAWWRQRRRKEDELREELQFHLEEEADERQADGLPEDEAQMGRPPRPGQRDAAAGRHARGVDVDAARATGAGHPLRPAHDGRQQDVQRDGDPVARAGDRRQHRHLQLHGFDPAALAAGARPAIARGPELAHRRSARCNGSNRAQQQLCRPKAGTSAGSSPTRHSSCSARDDSVFSSVFAYQGAGDLNLDGPGPGRARTDGIRVRRLFPRARRSAGRRAADRSGRRSRGRCRHGRHQLRASARGGSADRRTRPDSRF